jgi:hypothetical protein
MVESNWCRVALLDDPQGTLTTQYSTIVYVDVDIVFNETALIETATVNQNKSFSMSFKKELLGRRGGRKDKTKKKNRPQPFTRTIRTCSFIVQNGAGMRTRSLPMIHQWAQNYRPNAELQDQTVWNELYSCRRNRQDIKCYDYERQRLEFGEVKHCASWMDHVGRKVCFLSDKW